ncbi:hypothetical protein MCOR25_009849 [Pyricularia grisea]|nr:hypothetical protein MCOR25_009849 [Pyricularia grisea]
MAVVIGEVAQLLDATLDPQHHKKAEAALRIEEKKPQFSLTLLQIVNSDALPAKTRLAAALCFKNFIRSNYVDEDGKYKLPEDEVATLKQELVGLMISSPPNIQAQLGDAISIIADSDFWERWQTLIPDLVSRLSTSDFKITNGVLEVAHSIFVRWRPLFSSNELYTEINHVLSHFGEPFLKLLDSTHQRIEAAKGDAAQLKGWLQTMDLLVKILFDLSCQDLPPIIESNIASLCTLLQTYLSYTNPLLDGDDEEETVIELVKSDICSVLTLYFSKFDDDFGNTAQEFIPAVWHLLSSIGMEKRYDGLVSKALQFLTTVAGNPRHAPHFNSEAVIKEIVEKVVLPNISLRESDIELFEDEPIEFIRRDLEGSDSDSRRRAATDFLRRLQENDDKLVTEVVGQYINHYLGQADWKSKDTAVYLYLSIAAKGAVTAARGVQTVNPHVNVVDFFQQHIAGDLIKDEGVEPISKVNAIKYLHNFRSQLTKEQWSGAIQPLIVNMASSNYVVYTYAVITVERVLFLTNEQGEHLFTRADIEPLAKDLLEHLFNLVEKDRSPAKMQENEFLMRCIMRVLIVIKDGAVPLLDSVLDRLIAITNVIKQNPSNPRFYYYHFEAVGALIRYCAATDASKLEAKLWEPLSSILNEDVTEFVPYVFQLFAALLESSPNTAAPNNFLNLLKPVLSHTVWETRGNVPGCARFLSAIVPKVAEGIVAEGHLEAILGIFQRLLGSKKTEPNAFDILEAIVGSFPASALDQYFGTIQSLLFKKFETEVPDSFKQRFVRFYHLVSARGVEAGFGADYFIKHAEALQAKVFVPLYLNYVLPVTAGFARPVDRKLGVISYTKTLCDSTAFAQTYAKGWGFTCNHLLELLSNPPKVTTGAGDEFITEADVDDIGFGVGYTPLNTCKRGPRDDFPEITNVQTWVSEYMKSANQRTGGKLATFVQERLEDASKAELAKYLS